MALALMLAVTAGLVLAMATPTAHGSNAAAQSCKDRTPHDLALVTIPRLHWWKEPVSPRQCALFRGPIWDFDYPARPGQGKTMVIDAHDVTEVRRFGQHGPSYRAPLVKPGDKASIRLLHELLFYHAVTRPFAKWQCFARTPALEKKISMDSRRYKHGNGALVCTANNKPIKNWHVEGFYTRGCWPRKTDWKYLYTRWVLTGVRYLHGWRPAQPRM